MLLPLMTSIASGVGPNVDAIDILASEAAHCAECHPEEAESWRSSQHHRAWTDPVFQEGFIAEPELLCARCHAPMIDQITEVQANLDWYAAQSRGQPNAQPPTRGPEAAANLGITCAVCHWRTGGVIATTVSGEAPHLSTLSASLGSGELCAECHEFPFMTRHEGDLVATGLPAQSTWTEWQRWQKAGGTESCADCHMPDGDHRLAGAHDPMILRRAVGVDVRHTGDGVEFRLQARNIGHRLPTGDVFHHLTLELRATDGDFEEVYRIGRRFGPEVNPITGKVRRALVEDTRLEPGEERLVFVAKGVPEEYRLVYHFVGSHEQNTGWLTLEQLSVVVESGAFGIARDPTLEADP